MRPGARLAVAHAHEVVELRRREDAAVDADAAHRRDALERNAGEALRVRPRVAADDDDAAGASAVAVSAATAASTAGSSPSSAFASGVAKPSHDWWSMPPSVSRA